MMMKRMLALILALLLLPTAALAENAAWSFQASFSAREEGADPWLSIAELLNVLSFEGQLATYEDETFDLRCDMLLSQEESSRTSLHLYGTSDAWGIGSSLLGSNQLRLDTAALVEYALLINTYTGFPLHDLALLYPNSTEIALRGMREAWAEVMYRSEKTRTISLKELKKLCRTLRTLTVEDRNFVYWLKAISHDFFLESDVLGALEDMDDWLDENIGSKGLRIEVKNGVETWSAKNTVLYQKTVLESGSNAFLSLPELPRGFSLSYSSQTTSAPDAQDEAMTFQWSCEGRSIFGMQWQSAHPDVSQQTVSLSVSGLAAGLWDGLRCTAALSGPEESKQLDMNFSMQDSFDFALTAALQKHDAGSPAALALPETQLQTLNGAYLRDFISACAPSAIRGAIPLVLYAPASFCNMMMDFITDAGLVDMLDGSTPQTVDW